MTSPPPATGSLTFIGNATLLVRWGDITLLTDPNFLHRGQRAYLGYGLTSKRLTEPALSLAELPSLDAILLSHLHGDHWDRVAHRGLDHDLPVLTTPHASRRLQWRGFSRATGLRTWTSHTLTVGTSRVRITALPGHHAPGPIRRLLPPVMGSMLDFDSVAPPGSAAALGAPAPVRIYISGDTLVIDDLAEIPHRFPDIDTGVLHLGGTTLPGGLMVTMDGRQGADLLELIDPHTVVPVHHADYTVMASPLAQFTAEVERRGLADRVRYVDPGQTIPLSTAPRRERRLR